jgi:N-dimethylarginine dimethylaminohydrolase
MTSPVNFSVQYEINPWMMGNTGSIDRLKAIQQWAELRNALTSIGVDVVVLPKSPDYCPDAVFTANAGLIYRNQFLPSRFRYEERAVEEPFFINWFSNHQFSVNTTLPSLERSTASFEGAGDALFNSDRTILWYGIGFRSSFEFKPLLDKFFELSEIVVRPLELVNPNFYHLDTCFCPLDTGELLWYPDAFSDHSRTVIETWYDGRDIKVSTEDAKKFSCNAVSVGHCIVTPTITQDLRDRLTERGYSVIECDMSEFMKSGGACKCLTLEDMN